MAPALTSFRQNMASFTAEISGFVSRALFLGRLTDPSRNRGTAEAVKLDGSHTRYDLLQDSGRAVMRHCEGNGKRGFGLNGIQGASAVRLRSSWAIGALIFAVNLLNAQIVADTTGIPAVQAVRIANSIRIDGALDEEVWRRALILDRFVQREPNEGQRSSERTEVRVLYDEHNLYIGFRCWDSEPGRIVANEMRRDIDLLNNDCVEIYLDTFHDHRSAFFFSTNPLGAQRDGIIAANVSDEEQNWDWNGVWDNASVVDSAGWTAEIAIPFQTLRFHDARDLTWGVNFARFVPRKREEVYWSPIAREFGWWGKFRIDAYGHLTGLQGLKQPGDLELKPFVLSGVQRDFEAGRPYERQLGIGMDAKYHLTPNLTADISVNTDFAQVEADQEQTNLTRFELFFPEKRDFFLEGAAIFRFGERFFNPLTSASVLFFSRRIGLSEDNTLIPLLGGIKITGKEGSYSVGLLNMTADRTSYTNDDDELVIVPRTNFSVVRLRKDVFGNSTIGLIGLDKSSLDDGAYNRNIGFDATLYLNPNTQVNGFLAKTFSPDTRGEDAAGYVDLYYNDDFWTLLASHNTIQDNFNPEMGFFPRTGIRRTQVNFGISPRPRFLDLRQVALFDDFSYITNQKNELEARYNYVGWYALFQDGSYWLVLLNSNYENLDEGFEIHDDVNIQPGAYRFTNVYSEYQTDKSRPLSGLLRLRHGNFYDGSLRGYGIGANMKLGARFTLNLQYERNDVKLSAGEFSTNIVATRLLYTFSPRLFAKAYVQWNSDDQAITANFLVNFIHTPGSDLFLVYNEEIGTSARSLRTNNRTILLKFNYLFHL